MRTLLLLVALPALVAAQSVRTEEVHNIPKNHTGTASTDSLSTTSGQVKFFVGLAINTHVASDTIIVKQGSATIATVIVGGTAPAGPAWIPYNFRVDSPYVTIQRKKTSDVTTVFRTR